jgi:hypothetical protein
MILDENICTDLTLLSNLPCRFFLLETQKRDNKKCHQGATDSDTKGPKILYFEFQAASAVLPTASLEIIRSDCEDEGCRALF